MWPSSGSATIGLLDYKSEEIILAGRLAAHKAIRVEQRVSVSGRQVLQRQF